MANTAKKSLSPKLIDDCEIVVDTFQIKGCNTIGASKYKKYIMLHLGHSHTTDVVNQFGICDVFLTKSQALDLIEQLARTIATNDLLYPHIKTE